VSCTTAGIKPLSSNLSDEISNLAICSSFAFYL
jgi:hypothetical protein